MKLKKKMMSTYINFPNMWPKSLNQKHPIKKPQSPVPKLYKWIKKIAIKRMKTGCEIKK